MKIVERTMTGVTLRRWRAERYELVAGWLHLFEAARLGGEEDLDDDGDPLVHAAILHPLTDGRYVTVDREPGEMG